MILLIPFIETTTPFGVTFNKHGVAQKGFRYVFKFQKLTVFLDVCAINGIWAGRVDIWTNLWRMVSPIMRQDFKFSSFEECVTHLWNYCAERISNNKDNVSMEFLHFKVAMRKWMSLSEEDKFSWFKEVNFYDYGT